MDFWQVFPVAIALLLVLEGLMPFVSPGRWRNMLGQVSALDNRTIRWIGFTSMVAGVVLLYLVH